MKNRVKRRGVGRPSYLDYDIDKYYLMGLLTDMYINTIKVIEHLQAHIGKSSQETRKATTVERKLAELVKLINNL